MITKILIVLNCIFSIVAFQNTSIFNKYLLSPYFINQTKDWKRFFTHAFLHADLGHLLMNMYVLYIFGDIVEDGYFAFTFGRIAPLYYILLYVGAILASSFPSFEKHKNNPSYSAVGASGAVSAVVFSSILFNPWAGITFVFFPFANIPSFIFGGLYMAYSWYMTKKGGDNVAHDAHFWGAAFGFVFTIILKPSLGIEFINQIISRL